ncbi:MAG TPA: GNVR domain-containing protein [Pirellulales bacterium]|nr:GNVR domain-containing protein [Pirellulales bacterium]
MRRRENPEAGLGEVLAACRFHRRKMVTFFLASLCTCALVIVFAPKSYRSEAKLLVRLGRENVVLDSAATLGQSPAVAMPLSRESELNSVVAILKSRALAERVVDALGADTILHAGKGRVSQVVQAGTTSWLSDLRFLGKVPARERAVLVLQEDVRVDTARKSDVVQVSCLSSAPELSQAIVAKLVELYVDQHIEWNRTPKSREFFDQQSERLRRLLNEKEGQLVELKNDTGLASPADQRRQVVDRLGRLEDELLAAESSQAAAEAEVRLIEKKLAAYPATEITSRTTGFATEAADSMRAQLYALEMKEQELLARYTEEHPEVRQVRDQIAGSQAVLGREDRSLEQVTTGRTRTSEQAHLNLLDREPTLAAHRAKAEALRSQIEVARGKLVELNRRERDVATLAREVDLDDASYRRYYESLEQARIDEALRLERISNISIVQPASYELKPARPRRLTILAVGLIIGSCGSVGLALVAENLTGPRRSSREGDSRA